MDNGELGDVVAVLLDASDGRQLATTAWTEAARHRGISAVDIDERALDVELGDRPLGSEALRPAHGCTRAMSRRDGDICSIRRDDRSELVGWSAEASGRLSSTSAT